MKSEMTFRDRLTEFIENSMSSAMQYPFLEIYIVTQMNQGCAYKTPEDMQKTMEKLDSELKEEIEQGNISPISTEQFILNLASLVSFPTCMRPLFQKTMEMSNETYERLLKERKDVILSTIFKN